MVGEVIEALRFYADPEAWKHLPVKTREGLLGVEYENEAYKVHKDRGGIARAILAKLDGAA
ncbi:hypothetical protein IP68_12285 [Blastomonas sp. AAP25]|nr:hypothetical protein IP68_12285 [Blastomonas sp. AAP25]